MTHHDHHRHEDDTEATSYAQAFIEHNWPLLIFGSLFTLMLAMPLIFSGFLTWYAVAIVCAIGLALAIALTVPGFMGAYLLLVLGALYLTHPDHTYNPSGGLLTVWFLAVLLMGVAALPQRKQKTFQSAPAQPDAPAVPAAEESKPAVVPEKPQRKERPVAFDRGIAANGVTIIFGTESGNAENLAEMAQGTLQGAGFSVQVLDADKVDATHLSAFANLLVITSTWGDGDPPSNAIDLVGDIKSDMDLDLSGGQFSVLALGDTNYDQFCKCGKDFDEWLEKYGAKRFYNRVDCDLDFEGPYQDWVNGVSAELKKSLLTKPEFQEAAAAG